MTPHWWKFAGAGNFAPYGDRGFGIHYHSHTVGRVVEHIVVVEFWVWKAMFTRVSEISVEAVPE